MNDELRAKFMKIFERIEGGSTEDMMTLIDVAIDDEEISADDYYLNDSEVCAMFDTYWFTCTQCSWTMPMSEMADDDEWRCKDCAE